MTPSQAREIESLRKRFAPYNESYEVKDNRTEVLDGGVVFFFWETGLKNDDGTMASVYGRTRRWFKIGKRGHVESFDGNGCEWGKNLFSTW